MEPAALIDKGIASARKLVRNADPAELSGASPCEGWDARGVLAHLVGALNMMAAAAAGTAPPEGDPLGDDPVAAFEAAADAASQAFHAPGVLEKTVNLGPIGEVPGRVAAGITAMELCVHGWDFARATGQTIELDDEASTAVDAVVRQLVQPQFRQEGGPFRAEQQVPADAPIIDRVAAFTGRTV